MPVTSQELPRDKTISPLPAARPAPAPTRGVFDGILPNSWAVSIVLLVFGLMGWVAGGRYTLEGWIVWGNLFFGWLGASVHIPPLAGRGLWLILPVGLIYSRVEIAHFPLWRDASRRWQSGSLIAWSAWALIVLTDIGTTFTGVIHPAADAWPITQQLAASLWASLAWSALLTFAPEWFIINAKRMWRR